MWATNSDEFKKLIKLNKCNTTKMNNTGDETHITDSLAIWDKYKKVLGINWNTAATKSVFEFNHIINIASKLNVTKGNILKFSAIFFDPHGLICPN